jgi:hypothetical protein
VPLAIAGQLLESNDYDERFELGFGKSATAFTKQDIKRLLRGVALHYIIYSNVVVLDQMLEGLQSHDVVQLFRGNLR